METNWNASTWEEITQAAELRPPEVEIVRLIRVRFPVGNGKTSGDAYAFYNENGDLLTIVDNRVGSKRGDDQVNAAAIESIS